MAPAQTEGDEVPPRPVDVEGRLVHGSLIVSRVRPLRGVGERTSLVPLCLGVPVSVRVSGVV